MDGVNEKRDHEPGDRDRAPGRLEILQAFLNTANIEAGTDLFSAPEAVARWFIDRGLVDAVDVDPVAMGESVAFREAVRELLAARHDGTEPPAHVTAALDMVARRAAVSVRVDNDGSLVAVASADGLEGALGRLLLIALEASSSGDWQRLKVCTNQGCRWAFWDRSRNRAGRWCTMSLCGNQAKVRAHRERRRQ